jgi:hypothetical protein
LNLLAGQGEKSEILAKRCRTCDASSLVICWLRADYEALSVQRNAPRWLKMLKKHGFLPSTDTTATTPAAFAA